MVAPATETRPTHNPEARAITDSLSMPFDPREIKFKPQMVKNNRALAIAYIDVRLIEDRLDDVLGVENWQDEYEILPDGAVTCRLRLKISDQWVTKMDVGSPSEQPDGGDRLKAAFSDALKRAAVKFGIGRYLYRLPAQWVEYDTAKKQITQLPQLPAFALPRKATAEPRVAAPGPEAHHQVLPANGQELHRRLREYDAKLAAQKLCAVGGLLAHVTQSGVKAGYSANLTEWTGPAISFAVDAVKEFEQSLKPNRTAA